MLVLEPACFASLDAGSSHRDVFNIRVSIGAELLVTVGTDVKLYAMAPRCSV